MGLFRHIAQRHSLVLKGFRTVSGGDINKAFQVETDAGKFFLKVNDAERYPAMLFAEAKGLDALRETGIFCVPEVKEHGHFEEHQYLLMEWIERGAPAPGFWEGFGKRLALLHRQSHSSFGFPFHNYMGSLPQGNEGTHDFASFYAWKRLEPLVRNLRETKVFSREDSACFDKLYAILPMLIPHESPALLHGDLWSGNYMVGKNGEPVLIDPAPYYGHREQDIAMTKLFGGFDKRMYETYLYYYPLEHEWEQRISLMQLYPLLVHAVVFGGSYIRQCLDIVVKYAK